jgi:hypothetical protein
MPLVKPIPADDIIIEMWNRGESRSAIVDRLATLDLRLKDRRPLNANNLNTRIRQLLAAGRMQQRVKEDLE